MYVFVRGRESMRVCVIEGVCVHGKQRESMFVCERECMCKWDIEDVIDSSHV